MVLTLEAYGYILPIEVSTLIEQHRASIALGNGTATREPMTGRTPPKQGKSHPAK